MKTAIIAAIGDDFNSNRIISDVKKKKIDLHCLQKIKNCTSGLSLVITGSKKNDHIIFTHRAANEKLNLSLKECLKVKSKWFYITSLSGPYWKKNLDVIFKAAEKNNIKVAWNPGSTQLKAGYNSLKRYIAQTSVLILNKEEAMELAFNSGKKTKSIKKLLKILSDIGPEIVSISNGIKGAYIYSNNQFIFKKSLPAIGINTTGAGDAFGSSLVGGLILFKNNLKQALNLAVIRSNYVVRKIGAQEGLLTLNEVKKKLKV